MEAAISRLQLNAFNVISRRGRAPIRGKYACFNSEPVGDTGAVICHLPPDGQGFIKHSEGRKCVRGNSGASGVFVTSDGMEVQTCHLGVAGVEGVAMFLPPGTKAHGVYETIEGRNALLATLVKRLALQ
eukprot:4185133-Amphidinium_carterae.1